MLFALKYWLFCALMLSSWPELPLILKYITLTLSIPDTVYAALIKSDWSNIPPNKLLFIAFNKAFFKFCITKLDDVKYWFDTIILIVKSTNISSALLARTSALIGLLFSILKVTSLINLL